RDVRGPLRGAGERTTAAAPDGGLRSSGHTCAQPRDRGDRAAERRGVHGAGDAGAAALAPAPRVWPGESRRRYRNGVAARSRRRPRATGPRRRSVAHAVGGIARAQLQTVRHVAALVVLGDRGGSAGGVVHRSGVRLRRAQLRAGRYRGRASGVLAGDRRQRRTRRAPSWGQPVGPPQLPGRSDPAGRRAAGDGGGYRARCDDGAALVESTAGSRDFTLCALSSSTSAAIAVSATIAAIDRRSRPSSGTAPGTSVTTGTHSE